MVEFAGYDMPVQFPMGVLKEHIHTRTKAGLFDVSHMGQASVVGPDHAAAAAALEALAPGEFSETESRPSAPFCAAERRGWHS